MSQDERVIGIICSPGNHDSKSERQAEDLLRTLRSRLDTRVELISAEPDTRFIDRRMDVLNLPVFIVSQEPGLLMPWGYSEPTTKCNGKRKRNPDRWR